MGIGLFRSLLDAACATNRQDSCKEEKVVDSSASFVQAKGFHIEAFGIDSLAWSVEASCTWPVRDPPPVTMEDEGESTWGSRTGDDTTQLAMKAGQGWLIV